MSGDRQAKQCYWEWHEHVRRKIDTLKRNHWRTFLAKSGGSLSFKAFKYTQTRVTNSVAPLYRQDRTLATEKAEQAKLLFLGTSVVNNTCDTSDIVPVQAPIGQFDYPLATETEIDNVLQRLPSRKAKGGDGIPNELLKLAKSLLVPKLTCLFNACLKSGYFPTAWRTATTAILRKHDKDDYSEAGAYRPIALLSFLGKVFETLLAKRITYWAETNKRLAHGHMGGRRQHNVDDAFVILTSWIHQKWREGKVVTGLFLDVKSAYPSVNKQRLINILQDGGCPAYLSKQIDTYLDRRTNRLRLQDFLSDEFEIEDGLPQGSPLSVILYILYNSSLLINTDVSLQADKISLGFIDDVTHLVANHDIDMNILELEEEGDRSLEWGRTHGAIFDQKKAQLMHFTHKKHKNPHLEFGTQIIQAQTKELRWLGLWLDPKLTYGPHIHRMQHKGKATIAQLSRISRCYHGLSPKETKTLVTTILKPRILFGRIVWFNTRTAGKVSKIFQLLQNAANRLILGAFKSSPTEHMNHDANMITFKTLAVRYHHNYVYKRLTTPTSHPAKVIIQEEVSSSPIHRLLRKTDMFPLQRETVLETIYPYPEPPWIEPRWEVENLGEKREDVKNKVHDQIKQ